MKLPSRPSPRPGAIQGATKSATAVTGRPTLRANSTSATMTPMSPPWKDIPPSQTLNTDNGFCTRPANP